jgi:hypothetical protein
MAFEGIKQLNLIKGEENCDPKNLSFLMWHDGCWAAQPFLTKVRECANVFIEPRSLYSLSD